MSNSTYSDKAHYEIQVKGHLDERWASRFDGLSITTGFQKDGMPVTMLSGPISDQAALHGVLARIRDMGEQLISVNRLCPGEDEKGDLKSQDFQ